MNSILKIYLFMKINKNKNIMNLYVVLSSLYLMYLIKLKYQHYFKNNKFQKYFK